MLLQVDRRLHSGASCPRGAISEMPTCALSGSDATGMPVMSQSAVNAIIGSPGPPALPAVVARAADVGDDRQRRLEHEIDAGRR